jgi:hypothetical protein
MSSCDLHSFCQCPPVAFIPSASVLLSHSFLLPMPSCRIHSFCQCPPVAFIPSANVLLSHSFLLLMSTCGSKYFCHFPSCGSHSFFHCPRLVFTFMYCAPQPPPPPFTVLSVKSPPVATLLHLSLPSCGFPPFSVTVPPMASSSFWHCPPVASLLLLSLYSCGILLLLSLFSCGDPPPPVTVLL